MNQLPQPNAIIFRLPDADDGSKEFAEVTILEDGTLADIAQSFGVSPEDSFNELDFSTVILAMKETEDSSIELAAYDVSKIVPGQTTEVWEVMTNLDELLPYLLARYNEDDGSTLQ